MAVRTSESEFAKKYMPDQKAVIYSMYESLIKEGRITRPIGIPTFDDRKLAVSRWLGCFYRDYKNHPKEVEAQIAHFIDVCSSDALGDADIRWISELDKKQTYLTWLTLVKLQFPEWPNNTYYMPSGLDSRHERPEFFNGVINRHYIELGLDLAPANQVNMQLCILDFFQMAVLPLELRQNILSQIYTIVQHAKGNLWFEFARNADNAKLDWLWNYLKSKLALPSAISERMTNFKWERIYAEFELLNRPPITKKEEHESAERAYKNAVPVKTNGKKERINLTLTVEAKKLLMKMAGGSRERSQLVEDLINLEAKKRDIQL